MPDTIYKLRILRWMLANAYADWRFTIWQRDLDGNYCCDGRECCCGGESLRSSWGWYLNVPEKVRTTPEIGREE